MALKGNKGNLHEQVKDHFKIEQNNNFTGLKHDYHSEYDKGHGRIEHRECWTTNQIDWIVGITDWPHFSDYGEGKEIARSVRSHWSIANSLHWTLDVTFNEDSSRIRSRNASESVAIIRRIGLNLKTGISKDFLFDRIE